MIVDHSRKNRFGTANRHSHWYTFKTVYPLSFQIPLIVRTIYANAPELPAAGTRTFFVLFINQAHFIFHNYSFVMLPPG